MPTDLIEHPNTLRSITDVFTPEEIERYSTFHWRQVGDVIHKRNENGDVSVDNTGCTWHVWQTIGGMYRYLGTREQLMSEETPAEQLPLIPALDLADVSGGGPIPASGGAIPWQRFEEE